MAYSIYSVVPRSAESREPEVCAKTVNYHFLQRTRERTASHLEKLFEDISRQLYEKDVNLRKTLAQLKEQYVELEKAKAEADLANQQKLVFLASMSHELRTSVTEISASTTLCGRKNAQR